jgi:anti-anti-sigma factor
MAEAKIEIEIREPADKVRILELRGRISRSAEGPLMAAYQQALSGGAETVILSFRNVEAMDSTGLGLLITLSARAQREGQRLVAYGLGTPVQQAFAVSYLDEVLEVYADEAEALQSA